MGLLGIDIGTTHCKGGLFGLDGTTIKVVSRPNLARRSSDGYAYYDPEELWETVVSLIKKVVRQGEIGEKSADTVAAVGITSMAESGLLLDRRTGEARTPIYPWYEQVAVRQAEGLRQKEAYKEHFYKRGIRPTFKCSLAKILWLRGRDPTLVKDAIWLSAADYIAYRLTGCMGTDYSLAVRTYAFDMTGKTWDRDWLDSLGLDAGLFPPLLPSGAPVGSISAHSHTVTNLPENIPVAVTGHDHICGAFATSLAAGVIQPRFVFDSLGTAESLLGAFPERPLGDRDFDSGFSYGCHVAPGYLYWLGGLSTSGGSVEWLRRTLGDPPLSYDELETLLVGGSAEPTGILYYPYLSGSGSPHTDSQTRGAFVGLSVAHTRADFVRAVLEGVAYEVEYMRRAAQASMGIDIQRIVAAGGGIRNRRWMQIRADVSGCQIDALVQAEATLLGAALLAGIGSGVYSSQAEAIDRWASQPLETYLPDPDRHEVYQRLYEEGFLAFLEPLSVHYRGDSE